MSGENDQIEQVRKRVYAALSVAISDTGSRLLCQPFNPGSPEKVQTLATRVLGLVLTHLLHKLPEHEVEQLIAKINAEVVSQGTNNAGQVVLDRLLGAAFPAKGSPENEAANLEEAVRKLPFTVAAHQLANEYHYVCQAHELPSADDQQAP